MRRPNGPDSHAVSPEIAWWHAYKKLPRFNFNSSVYADMEEAISALQLLLYFPAMKWIESDVAKAFGVSVEDVELVTTNPKPHTLPTYDGDAP